MSSGGRIEPQEGGLIDPSYLEQLSILNQLQTQAAPMQQQMLGSGLINAVAGGGGGLIIPDYRPQAQKFRQDLTDIFNATNQGGGGVDFNPNDGLGTFSGRAPAPVEVGIVQTVNPDGTLTANAVTSPVIDYGPVVGTPLGPLGGGGGGGGFSGGAVSSPVSDGGRGSLGMGNDLGMLGGGGGGGGGDSGGMGDSGPSGSSGDGGGSAAGPGESDGGGGGGGGGKIICTAMNNAYGFGSFRNAIWIAYADKHLTKAHEVGYHTLFLGLVDFGFKRGNGKLNTAVRKVMEWGTRHRSTDLRAEMRGTKRDSTGRIIRMIFEPLCYAVGKLKGY